MLALSLISVISKVKIINYFWAFSSILIIPPWSPSKTRIFVKSFQRSRFEEGNPPLDFYSDRDSVLSSCVVVYYWFIVAHQLGFYHPLSPCWRRPGSQKKYLSPKPRKPPNESPRSFAIFTIYLLAVLTHAAAIANASEPLHHLSALPITLFSFFATATFRSRLRDLYEQRRITTSFFSAPHLFPITSQASFSSTSQFRDVDNSTKLSMLCAWNN